MTTYLKGRIIFAKVVRGYCNSKSTRYMQTWVLADNDTAGNMSNILHRKLHVLLRHFSSSWEENVFFKLMCQMVNFRRNV